jgi:hypothetical protein
MPDEARRLYALAARAEVEAYRALPADRTRTRAITAISAGALFARSGQADEGLAFSYRVLGHDLLPPASVAEMEALVDDMRNQRTLASMGLRSVTQQFEWILRGGRVGAGIATLDVVGQKIAQIEKLGVRVFEYVANIPLRRKGPPDPAVDTGLRIMIGQPAAGSFRFGFRFATPEQQLPLFGTSGDVNPEQVGAVFSSVLEAIAEPDDEERLSQTVPAEDYRETFLKLVRNLAPDGQRIGEIELREARENRTVTRLVPSTRTSITRQIRRRAPDVPHDAEVTDTLRGLDLNEGWILLGRDEQTKIRLSDDLAIEDVIGPLVNQPVTVSFRRSGQRSVAYDIQPAIESGHTGST